MTCHLVECPDRAAWLERRRELVTASDAAAILGVDPWRGPLAVYLAKTRGPSLEDAQRESRWLQFGRNVEGAVASWYEADTGRKVDDLGAFSIAVSDELPWLGATLDRFQWPSRANPAPPSKGEQGSPLEAKAVADVKAREWRDAPPLHYQVQLQAQLAVTGAGWGTLAALVGGVRLVWRDMVVDDRLQPLLLEELEAFRLRVERRTPPPADARPATITAVRKAFLDVDGTTVSLGAEELELAKDLRSAKRAIETAKAEARRIEAELRMRVGEAAFGLLPDGTYLESTLIERAGHTVAPSRYRSFRQKGRPRRSGHGRRTEGAPSGAD